MDNIIKISIIIPVYNSEDCLEKCLKSILSQTLKEIEVIAVDDASTDTSYQMLLEYEKEYPEIIRVFQLLKNSRQGAARNKGIQAAKGKYICFIDSDDYIAPNMLEKFYCAIEMNKADIVGTNKYFRVSENKNKVKVELGGRKRTEYLHKISQKQLTIEEKNTILTNITGIWMNLFKRSIIQNYNIRFPERVSYEDNYFVTLYLCYVERYCYVNAPFYYYVQHKMSTVSRKDKSQLSRISVEKDLLAEVKKRDLYIERIDGYEVMATQRWYINTVGVIFKFFPEESLTLIEDLWKDFYLEFPSFERNKYYNKYISLIDRIKIKILKRYPYIIKFIYSRKYRC